MTSIISLNQNTDFRRVYHRGKSFVDPVLVSYVMPNKTGCIRVGITTSKKIGKAVVRNRARRVIRAAFFGLLPQLSDGYDIVFVARGKTPYRKSTEIEQVMARHLVAAGVVLPKGDTDEKVSD